jgi:hypothetical protein
VFLVADRFCYNFGTAKTPLTAYRRPTKELYMFKFKISEAKREAIAEAQSKKKATKARLTNTDNGIAVDDDDDTFTIQVNKKALVKYMQDKLDARGDDAITDGGNVACPIKDDDNKNYKFTAGGMEFSIGGNILHKLLK